MSTYLWKNNNNWSVSAFDIVNICLKWFAHYCALSLFSFLAAWTEGHLPVRGVLRVLVFHLYFFSFLQLPGWLVRLLLWNVVWDKRSGEPETQWPPGEASLFFLALLSPYLYLILSPPLFKACFPSKLFLLFLHLSLTLSLCQAAVLWCGAGPGTLAWPLSSHTHTHTHNTAIFFA